MQIIHENNVFYIGKAAEKEAFISYQKNGNVLTIDHTIVSDKLQGKGIGKMLLEAVAEYARANQYKVNATCWFADLLLKKEDQYKDILG